jgi:hypothetical protein
VPGPSTEDGEDQGFAIAEVVLCSDFVSLSGCQADLSQRNGIDTALGEQPFRGHDQGFPSCPPVCPAGVKGSRTGVLALRVLP